MADEDNTGAEPSWFDPMHCGGRVEPRWGDVFCRQRSDDKYAPDVTTQIPDDLVTNWIPRRVKMKTKLTTSR